MIMSVSSHFLLSDFSGPPHIIKSGVVTATKGDRVVLKCVANAHPPATYTWSYPVSCSKIMIVCLFCFVV